MALLDPVLDTLDGFLAWISTSLGQTADSYCMLESAEDHHVLVAKDGSLVSVIKMHGATYLVGPEEFTRLHNGISNALRTGLGQSGHAVQLYFMQDRAPVSRELDQIIMPARQTAHRLGLKLDDLLNERIEHLSRYCIAEEMYLVLWTRTSALSDQQFKAAAKQRKEKFSAAKIPPLRNAQNFFAGVAELREIHNTFVKGVLTDLNELKFFSVLLEVHDACYAIRTSVDPDFTDFAWRATLPGDNLPVRETKNFAGDISDILWPSLSKQLIPRDGANLDLRTARIGDRIYSSVYIDLFPKELMGFVVLMRRIANSNLPWRISFLLESDGMQTFGIKKMLASILSFASTENKLINGAYEKLKYIEDNTDEAVVKLRVTLTTWARSDEPNVLKHRLAELAKAVQGWGYVEVSEFSGDAYAGVLGSALGITTDSMAIASIAPLSDVVYMFPLTRPASPWTSGAVMFRSPDGKPWPYQPGSTLQTTWIDLVYARPGSGKSVLSNMINFALCLSPGITRLPRIAIIDIGPSSSGLISLLKEALPEKDRHLVAYHRLRMVKEMAINPFDTQLGCRFPTPQERAFLVNFLTLLATPVGETKAYDGIADMVGLIVEELYKELADDAAPRAYTSGIEVKVDEKIKELNFTLDEHTSWWEVCDFLFKHGEIHLANLAQRYAMPILADAASSCRKKMIEDLYGSIKAPTGESIINAFSRMISSAVREYPILARVTSFDLGEARVVSLDLDEVAKTGGDAADRQTAIMYMIARYILARHYYLTEETVGSIPELYKDYHLKRIIEIREDPKRIVFDEFHRTSKAQAVRDQVIVDMREGRKWKVQVALLSQSIDDFDSTMVEFATSIFILDAGPKQAVEKSAKVFGLSSTAQLALENRVHGPRAEGSTFLAQFATKSGMNTQLLSSTIGPMELWAFNTTAEDARIRNALYKVLGATETRKILATLYPNGSAASVVEQRMNMLKSESETFLEEKAESVIDGLIKEIIAAYNAEKTKQ